MERMDTKQIVEKLERLNERNRLLEKRQRGIQEIAAALGSTSNRREILHTLGEQATQMLDAERATVFLVNQETGRLESEVVIGPEVHHFELEVGQGLAGWVAREKKTANVKDAYKDPRFDPSSDVETGFRTRSILCQPMKTYRGELVGVIQVLNKRTEYFTTEDADLLSTITTQATISIVNAKFLNDIQEKAFQLADAQESLRRNYSRLETLYTIQGATSQTWDRDSILKDILEQLRLAIPCKCVAALVTSHVPVKLYYLQGTERRTRVVAGPASAGVLAQVAGSMEPIVDPSAFSGDAVIHPEIDVEIHNLVCVPLLSSQGDSYGAIALVNRQKGRFGQEDEQLVRITARQISVALERLRQHEELVRSNNLALIGQALSGVVHDLKSPMNIILGHVQLMEGEEEGTERARHAREIIKQFKHIQTMTQEVLAFSRGEAQLFKRPIYLQEFLGEMEELLGKEFDGRSIALKVENHYKGKFRADEGKLKRLFFNIARNAREAMPDGGTFTILVEEEGDVLRFSFTDTGHGIPPEIKDHLFQSFVTQGKKDGTGLGLAIVKKIVEQHSGSIHFTSQQGLGTRFVIEIPKES